MKVRVSWSSFDPPPNVKMDVLARVIKAAQVSRIRLYDAPVSAGVDRTYDKPLNPQNAVRFNLYLFVISNFFKKVCITADINTQQF